LVAAAADNGAVLLDGSEPAFEWVETEGARDPGLVPLEDVPAVEREDYVFNANDSFWLPHAEAVIEGDYSPLHGDQRTARSPRTRENATVLADESATGPAGEDGDFTLDELADAALANRGYTARTLLEDVAQRCDAAPPVSLPAVPAEDDDAGGGAPALPAAEIDVGPACTVLAGWDGVYDVDRAGPPVWREMMHQFDGADLREAGPLWAEGFDAERPVETPAGLAAPDGDDDPVLTNLARAVQILDTAGIAVDATLGDVQFARRGDETIAIHGGDGADGTTNIVGHGSGSSILDPELLAAEPEDVAPGSSLTRVDDVTGYPVNNGTSFMLVVELTDDGPRAKVFLTYGNSEDRTSDDYTEATERFSAKDWRDVAFTEDDVAEATIETTVVRG
jgi:acyl-homoserine-lactone acylase